MLLGGERCTLLFEFEIDLHLWLKLNRSVHSDGLRLKSGFSGKGNDFFRLSVYCDFGSDFGGGG